MPRELLMQNSFAWTDAEGRLITTDKALRCNARNLLVEGKTYQNFFTHEGEFINDSGKYIGIGELKNLKSNTTYTVEVDLKSDKNFTSDNKSNIFRVDQYNINENGGLGNGVQGTITSTYQTFKFTFTTVSNFKRAMVILRNNFHDTNVGLDCNTMYAQNIKVIEGDYTNTDLPAKINGIESVAERESKNLLENVKWHDGWIHRDGSLGNHSGYPNAIYSDLIDINTNNLYYTNIVSYSDVSSLRYRCYDINGKGLNISTGNIKELYTGNSFKPTKKIRILILDKTVTPLPSNPILLPNLYTHGDVNVKGARPWMSTDIELILKPNTRYNYVKTIESISKGSNNVTPGIQLWDNETKTYMTNLDASSFTTQSATNYLIKLIVNNGTASTTDCEANFKNIAVTEANLYPVKITNKGKNLLDISTFKPISYDTIQASKDGNVITVKGLKTSDVEAYTDARAGNIKVYLEENKTYSFSFKSDGKYGSAVGTDTVEIFFMLD